MMDRYHIEVDETFDPKVLERFGPELSKFPLRKYGKFNQNPTFDKLKMELCNFQFRKNDVMVCGVPKSGTTWIQEIVYMMCRNPKLEPIKSAANSRIPYYEIDISFSDDEQHERYILQQLSNAEKDQNEEQIKVLKAAYKAPKGTARLLRGTEIIEGRRVYKTHIAVSMLHPEFLERNKVVYMIRDPRDVVLSWYPYSLKSKHLPYKGTFDDFYNMFLSDYMMCGPIYEQIKDAWEKRDHRNIHFIYYETLKSNTKEELRKLAQFLEVDFTDEQIKKLEEMTSFSAMNIREGSDNHNNAMHDGKSFCRKGVAGGWKTDLTKERIEEMTDWIAKHYTPLNLDVDYEQI